jgi:hypothetical protein
MLRGFLLVGEKMADKKGEKKWMFFVRLILLDFRLVVRVFFFSGCQE